MHDCTIPQSVFDYMTKDGVRSAVDHLLSSRSDDFPNEITSWPEVRNYHRALLAAYQVRQEHIMFLIDLWDSIWGSALQESGSLLSIVPFTEQHNDYDKPSPDFFWSHESGHFRQLRLGTTGAPIGEVGVEYWPAGIKLYALRYESSLLTTSLPPPWTDEVDLDGCNFTDAGQAIPEEPSLEKLIYEFARAAKAALIAFEA